MSRKGEGAISAVSSDTSIATVSVSGTTLTVTSGISSGSATITVKCARAIGYAEETVTLSVTNIIADSTLDNNTPETIQLVSQSGQASNLWSVGDKIGITINGTIGSLWLSSVRYAFIIGFNHNSSIEGTNSIHFMFGKTSEGQNIAFVDEKYYMQSNKTCFNMNTSDTNSGGWSSSLMRSTICPAFKNVMPSAWQSVIAPCPKYTDNTGGGSNTASYVTSTTDYIFLLSEYEVYGARSYANSKEKDYQAQYTYFTNGNSKVFNKHSSTSITCRWWLRSVDVSNRYEFCDITENGNNASDYSNYSLGFAPAFKVA